MGISNNKSFRHRKIVKKEEHISQVRKKITIVEDLNEESSLTLSNKSFENQSPMLDQLKLENFKSLSPTGGTLSPLAMSR